MRNQGCVNGTLDEANYSSPMPVIGYVAVATLICLLFMLFDIFAGFREKKRWIPCRFFPLNSVTLTLVAIATKLPVDLTTPMPSAQDQFSKLTGTMLVCIYMGFIMPSLGLTRKSECFSNMVSLTIFVATVFVNSCIQMHTGVIFLFRGENIIVLWFMMLLLVTLWISAKIVNTQKEISTDYIKEQFTNGKGSLLRRLKVCYLHSYATNPQFSLCTKLICPSTCAICVICTAILVRGIIRLFVLKELVVCKRTSDYKWSMWAIVASQVITVFVGCLGTILRLVTMAEHVEGDDLKDACEGIIDNCWLGNRAVTVFISPPIAVVVWIEGLVIAPYTIVAKLVKGFREGRESDDGGCFSICKPDDDDNNDAMKEFKWIQTREMGLDDWTLKKGLQDMKRWVEPVNKIKSSNHLIKLLSETPSRDSLTIFLIQNHSDPAKQRYKISTLSMVILTKVATIFIPSTMSHSLFNSLDEVLEVIHYIDRRMNASSFKSKTKSIVSKALWAGKSVKSFNMEPKFVGSTFGLLLDQAIENIIDLKQRLILEDDVNVKEEVAVIIDFIEHKSYASIEELINNVQQLYVDMLNKFLTQLPGVIFKDIVESPPEDLEERVKLALKIVHKIEKLEAFLQWSFPVGTTISNLIADEVTSIIVHENRSMTTSESNGSANIFTCVGTGKITNVENLKSAPPEINCNTNNVLRPSGELELCKDIDSVLVAVLCIILSIVLIQAVLRSFILKQLLFLCDGSSDYLWSVWVILATQVVTILVGGLGTSFRCSGGNLNSEQTECSDIKEFQDLIRPGEKGLEEWTLRMGSRDMNKWMELSKNNAPNYNINRILSKSALSEDSLINQFKGPAARTCNISSLTVVFLVRIATVCTPPTVGASLSTALNEVFEVIHFVEKKMGSTSFENKRKFKLAKAALEGPNSRDDLQRICKIYRIEA
ncbi:hypothetical protein Sjap_009266 [Stephania japonica]|uniref:Uncharacterized protein n=1 Tax=Stephania japonica TaxID=461633 RepID=A0AAP0JR59_9MAGN